jgi:large subunit ribosomal protein L44
MIFRMEGESGRATCEPIFIVGVYSGEEKIGESYGPSIIVAENRAASDALKRFFCQEETDASLLDHLPSSISPFEAARPFPIYDTEPAFQ